MSMIKKGLLAVGLTMGASAGVGFLVESHTNEVARDKIVTIDTCMDILPAGDVITVELEDCFDGGVPGGRTIGKDHFKVGDPIEYVKSYRSGQVNEAEAVEIGRIAAWSTLPFITIAAGIYFVES